MYCKAEVEPEGTARAKVSTRIGPHGQTLTGSCARQDWQEKDSSKLQYGMNQLGHLFTLQYLWQSTQTKSWGCNKEKWCKKWISSSSKICSVEKKETLRYFTTKNNSRENGKKLTLSEWWTKHPTLNQKTAAGLYKKHMTPRKRPSKLPWKASNENIKLGRKQRRGTQKQMSLFGNCELKATQYKKFGNAKLHKTEKILEKAALNRPTATGAGRPRSQQRNWKKKSKNGMTN